MSRPQQHGPVETRVRTASPFPPLDRPTMPYGELTSRIHQRVIRAVRKPGRFSQLFHIVAYHRAAALLSCLNEYLPSEASVVDIGCGMGHLARLLLERSNSVFGLDLHDLRAVELPFVLGDAGNLPLADKSVDVVLLVTVLHHMDAAMHLEVLKEATRVARRRVVLLEDVYRNRFGKRLTFLLDRLANLDFGPHPHSNRTTPEWQHLLEAVGCHSVRSGE